MGEGSIQLNRSEDWIVVKPAIIRESSNYPNINLD